MGKKHNLATGALIFAAGWAPAAATAQAAPDTAAVDADASAISFGGNTSATSGPATGGDATGLAGKGGDASTGGTQADNGNVHVIAP